MGTRHITAVLQDGQFKVAQYGQWDGYFEGQGQTVIDFLKTADMEKFRAAVRNCTFLSDEQIKQKWKEVGADDSGWVPMPVSDQFRKNYPELSRDTGAGVLEIILEKNGVALINEIDFVKDGLFCEFAYVVNLDENKLEIYTGFEKEKCEGRFAPWDDPKEDYRPVTLHSEYSFENLPGSLEDA